jgi:carbon storage regulator CsrA
LVFSKDTLEVKAPIRIELPTGERIEVAVLVVKGKQVRIGTDAPDEITIVREELSEGLQSKT